MQVQALAFPKYSSTYKYRLSIFSIKYMSTYKHVNGDIEPAGIRCMCTAAV